MRGETTLEGPTPCGRATIALPCFGPPETVRGRARPQTLGALNAEGSGPTRRGKEKPKGNVTSRHKLQRGG